MGKERLLAFSDGVIAIIITIMVLELRPPHEATITALREVLPTFLSYVLSFIYVAIYWNNHHHMLLTAERVNGGILWANMHLLFWLSLIPFATAWLGEAHGAAAPTMVYGCVLFLAGAAYTILQTALLRAHGPDCLLARAVGNDWVGKASLVLYAIAVAAALWNPLVSKAIYVLVALLWFVPDRRIEKLMGAQAGGKP